MYITATELVKVQLVGPHAQSVSRFDMDLSIYIFNKSLGDTNSFGLGIKSENFCPAI